jgi:hypothetical protein
MGRREAWVGIWQQGYVVKTQVPNVRIGRKVFTTGAKPLPSSRHIVGVD